MSFDCFGLRTEILKAVAEQGYTEPTPVQAQAIPVILEGRDVVAAAQTGTGKTAGFTLPILELLYPHANTSTSPARHPVRALILVPTRELAAQVEEAVRTYGKHVPLRYAVVYGGIDINPQIEALRQGVEILVATPGRLLDHVHQKTVNLSRVQILVLDEGDRMLDMGFLPDIRRILTLLPPRRQNLLFSATFSSDVRKLAESFLNSPVWIDVTPRTAAAELVRQQVYRVDKVRKRELLTHLVRSRHLKQVLVFTSTRIGANRLARQLERDGIVATALHSDKSQMERTRALAEFKAGKVEVLVATDLAARGLDIEQLPCVINYELPRNPEDYVHRIGRTGRAGSQGDAISLVSQEEEKQLADIERLLRTRLEKQTVPGFEPGARPGHKPARMQPEPPRADPPQTPREPALVEEAPLAAPRLFPHRRRVREVAALLGGLLPKK